MTFQSATAAGDEVVFTSAGDFGCQLMAQTNLNDMMLHQMPDALVITGDLTYGGNANCWFDITADFDEKVRVALGNHDDETPEKFQANIDHYEYFSQDIQYYSFDIEDVHFLMLVTEPETYSASDPQYIFAENDLRSAWSDDGIEWIVVSFHKTMYTAPNSNHGDWSQFRNLYHPLFEKYGVDLVLSSHVHNYQRTFPIKYNPAAPSSPIITDTDPHTYYSPSGLINVVVGTGGINLVNLTGTKPYLASAQYEEFGYLAVKVSRDDTSTRMFAKFFVAGKHPVGLDYFEIIKPIHDNYGEPDNVLNGNNYVDSYGPPLTKYTISTWFRSCEDFPDNTNHFIANKGGVGADEPGHNMNYGVWMIGTGERLRAGFEAADGTDYFITSISGRFNDCHWHHVTHSFDGSTMTLYVDGRKEAEKTGITQAPDNTGIQPFRIGANSFALNSYFVGEMDHTQLSDRLSNNLQARDAAIFGVYSGLK